MAKDSEIKFKQVWRAIKEYKIDYDFGMGQKDCVIPVDTKVVVLHDPVSGYKAFSVMPLSSKRIDKNLVPNLEQMERNKEGFGVSVFVDRFKECFVLDENQNVNIDYEDGKKFWETILAHNK